MNTPFSVRHLALAIFPLLLGTMLLSGAQVAEKQPPRKEEEEEAPLRPGRTRPLRVEDDEPAAKARTQAVTPAAVDLAVEADRTRNPIVRDLFKSLAVPHDRLIFTSPPRIDLVEPLPKYIPPKRERSVFIKTRRFNERFEVDPAGLSISLTKDHGVLWYEQFAINQVTEFLKHKLEKEPPNARKFLSRAGMLREAERALTAVTRFHESARERGVREGNEWEYLEKRLREKLREVQIEQLRLLVEARDWEAATALGAHLVRTYPDVPQVQNEVPRLLAQQPEHALDEKNYQAARIAVESLLREFPKSKAVEAARDRLHKRSLELLAEAGKLLEQGNKTEADKRVLEAERTWPYSNELRTYRLRLGGNFTILHIGVPALPESLSPATAGTDVEKQALDLLFESLVKYRPHTTGGPRYEPVLAADTPRLTPLGRAFQMHRQAYWSNGERVTAPDVSNTVELLRDSNWPGRPPAWPELLDRRNAVSVPGDAFYVKMTLSQGYLDPLSLMTFKVLPQARGLKRADDKDFARRPVGSGPFRYEGVVENQAVFTANSFYGTRPEKPGRPRIGEIRMQQTSNPAVDLQNGRLQLLLSPAPAVLQQLRDSNTAGLRILKLPTRRIWFLAVNHRRAGLEDVRLRRALALAISREPILNDCFRSGAMNEHRPLNGPYLPDTWAYNPDVGAADPHQRGLASELAQQALRERGKQTLTLRYPAGDEAVRRACEMIVEQVRKLNAGLVIELVERTPADLRQDVERDFHYDLAYWSWDYPDHTYWLWPLLALRDGQNLFGSRIDPDLESLFRQLLTHREFARVQELTHQVHKRFHEEMPFIPLWQLDTHIAVHPRLELPSHLDGLAIFSDVDEWRLKGP